MFQSRKGAGNRYLEMSQMAKVVGGDVSFNLKMKCIDDILDTEILEMSKSWGNGQTFLSFFRYRNT